MIGYLARRALLGLAIIAVVSLSVFALTNVAVDPATVIAGEGASQADVESVRRAYGFDRPVAVRYFQWLGNAARGNLGDSYRQRRPVINIVRERLPVTVGLACLALAISLAISLPLAIAAAVKRNSIWDRLALAISVIGQAVPAFWIALLCILVFSVHLAWLPASGSTTLAHFVLPAFTLSFYSTPSLLRLTRAGLIDVLQSDYIRTARAKGLQPGRILLQHALRNALAPVIAIASVQFGFMLSGSVVIETIFSMQGIGYLAWEAVTSADLPLVQALVLVTAFFYIVLTLAADVLNAWLDPRIRLA
jgi:peptide/nickel transport system permease protein